MIITVTPNTAVDRTVRVPGFAVGRTLKGRVLRCQPAGKGINVSRCLAELGHKSIASGLVGKADHELFARSLSADGVEDRLVEVDGRTRDNITYHDPDAGTETHVRLEGFEVDINDVERLDNVLASVGRSDDIIVFAGSTPPGFSEGMPAELVDRCRKRGAQVCVDGNGPAYNRAVEAGPMLIKPNLMELQSLSGSRSSSVEEVVATARSLLDRVEIVVVSMGAVGAVCVSSDGSWHARGAHVEAGGMVGCGDALLAGFLAAWEERSELVECLRLGVACGGAASMVNVAGEINRGDVDEQIRNVRVSTVVRD